MKFGYARISTPKQSLENQIALLKEAGCERIFADIISGFNQKKEQFEMMITQLRKGDIVMVTGIDRLGRSTKDLSILIEDFHKNDIHLVVLGYDMDTRTSAGKMIFNFMAMIAENERMRNLERIKQGIEGARFRGKHIGRPQTLTKEQTIRMLQLYESKQLTVKELCIMYNVCKTSFYNYVKKREKNE